MTNPSEHVFLMFEITKGREFKEAYPIRLIRSCDQAPGGDMGFSLPAEIRVYLSLSHTLAMSVSM